MIEGIWLTNSAFSQMTLSERNGTTPTDWTGRWWDEMELPHIITTRWMHFNVTSTYGSLYAGITELQILQGRVHQLHSCQLNNSSLTHSLGFKQAQQEILHPT